MMKRRKENIRKKKFTEERITHTDRVDSSVTAIKKERKKERTWGCTIYIGAINYQLDSETVLLSAIYLHQ